MENFKIDAFIAATGASVNTAYDYLVGEEGLIDEALISYRGDCGEPLRKQYDYAVVNGYKNGLSAYTHAVYCGYVTTCERCVIQPMTFDAWAKSLKG